MPVIIAGKRRGAKLLVPQGEGVRPTLVRVREALFSMLMSEFGTFEGLRVLDPFAGAGMLGLEAWSRGAAHVDFVECSREHYAILAKNIATLRAGESAKAILGQSPRDWYRLPPDPYDLVLCDPPYTAGLMPQTLQMLAETRRLRPNAIISVELNAADTLEIPDAFSCLKQRKYGKCQICLLTRKPEDTAI
ncbi:MAG: 16S rRNA (guanine(966)-N(2))-methyltransferase RsmD [Proteobacteria bacterium]|nr:16S rRNA (guanine(966)-N(2))-methyltransferase RsmD [Pseudomonadota bacterium]